MAVDMYGCGPVHFPFWGTFFPTHTHLDQLRKPAPNLISPLSKTLEQQDEGMEKTPGEQHAPLPPLTLTTDCEGTQMSPPALEMEDKLVVIHIL